MDLETQAGVEGEEGEALFSSRARGLLSACDAFDKLMADPLDIHPWVLSGRALSRAARDSALALDMALEDRRRLRNEVAHLRALLDTTGSGSPFGSGEGGGDADA